MKKIHTPEEVVPKKSRSTGSVRTKNAVKVATSQSLASMPVDESKLTWAELDAKRIKEYGSLEAFYRAKWQDDNADIIANHGSLGAYYYSIGR